MKVLKDNHNKMQTASKIITIQPYPRHLTCDGCQSELEYEESDLRMGFLGCMHLDCPLCGHSNMLDDNENNVDLTADNVEFPTHFWHTSKETGAADRCNAEQVKEEVKRAIKYFRENKDEFSWSSSCGNLYVCVHRFEGDETYDVVVSNNFYNTQIFFEDEDY